PLVLKQLDFLNAWQGKKPDLLWFSMFLTDQPLRALNRLSQKKLDHRVLLTVRWLDEYLI
ncbi:MAG TPA: hypothetical protein VJ951_13815, partial [Bacteroidales bacterium]|nr:hypothetical protein [Bacteroidales bacterium]